MYYIYESHISHCFNSPGEQFCYVIHGDMNIYGHFSRTSRPHLPIFVRRFVSPKEAILMCWVRVGQRCRNFIAHGMFDILIRKKKKEEEI